jgi:hypothetical protein
MTTNVTMPSTKPAAEVQPATNPWTASLWGGALTAIAIVAAQFFVGRDMPWLYIPSLLLAGAAPVLGYQIAAGKLGKEWLSIVAGAIGAIVPVIGWPILVGLLTKGQSVWKLLLWSILGLAIGLIVFLLLGTFFGANPDWINLGFPVAASMWGGSVSAAMAAGE